MERNLRGRKKFRLSGAAPHLVVLLLVVCAAGVVLPAWPGAPLDGPQQRAKGELKRIAHAFRAYEQEHGVWPHPGREHLKPSATVSAFLGGFIGLFNDGDSPGLLGKDSAVDPWGFGYQVYWFPIKQTISLVSVGPNGMLDTSLQCLASGRPSSDDLVLIINVP